MKYNLSDKIDRRKLFANLRTLILKGAIVELIQKFPKRTSKQNRYMHVLFSLFGIHFGYTLDEAKIELKRECPFMRYEKNGKIFLRKTSKMDTKELTDFIDWMRTYSGKQGCPMPSPEEYLSGYTYFENLIESYKEYL